MIWGLLSFNHRITSCNFTNHTPKHLKIHIETIVMNFNLDLFTRVHFRFVIVEWKVNSIFQPHPISETYALRNYTWLVLCSSIELQIIVSVEIYSTNRYYDHQYNEKRILCTSLHWSTTRIAGIGVKTVYMLSLDRH